MSANRITIAVDGYSSCGKSTLARALAQSLDYVYIDTGAMYRAVTLYTLEQGINPHDWSAVAQLLPSIRIRFESSSDGPITWLNDRRVDDRIRNMDVNRNVSPIASIPAVRRKMVEQQREMSRAAGVVLDGRDIGTVVFPEAPVKLFLSADLEERVRRRKKQLEKSRKEVSALDIRRNLLERDYIDSTRSDSPLRKAVDAILIDNTNLTPIEQLAVCLAIVKARM